MRRKYLSLILAAVISLGQIAGTGQLVQASEVSGEIGQEVLEGTQPPTETSGETGQQPETGEETGQQPEGETPGETQQPETGEETGQQPEGETPEETQPPTTTEGEGQQPEEGQKPSVTPEETTQENYRPVFYLSDESRLVLGGNLWFSRINSGYWQAGDGSTKEMELAGAESANPDIVSVERDETSDGWQLTAKGLGETTVTFTCAPLTDVSGDNAVSAELLKKEMRVIVSDKAYSIQIEEYPQNVFPGTDVNLTAKVSAYGENGMEADASDAVVVWTAESDTEGILKASGEGNNFQFHVPEGNDGYGIQGTAEVRRGEEVVASGYFWIYVTNVYYQLEIENQEEAENMWPGETKTITPVLYRYETGKEPEAEPAAKFQFVYNEEELEIQKDGAAVEQNASQDSGSFTVKRLKNGNDWMQISAYLDNMQQGFVTVRPQWKNYNDISIQGGINEYHANLFVDDENPAESDTAKEFTLDTSKLGGDYEIEWRLETNEVSADPGVYTISGEKGEIITIDAKKLKDDLKNKLGESEGNYYSCQLIAVVKVGDEEWGLRTMQIEIMEPFYSISPRGYEVVRGTVITYKDEKVEGYAQDKTYPGGTELMFELKELKILDQTPKIKDTEVFTTQKDGADLLLIAENCGYATIEYKVALPSGGEKVFTFEKSVVTDRYEFDMASNTGTTELLPGAELKMETEVWHEFYNENAGKKQWEKLAPENYTVTFYASAYSSEEDIISVEKDGTVKAVGGSGDGYLEAVCKIPAAGEDYEEWASDEICVRDSYEQAVAKEIFAAPGETVSNVALEWKTFDLEHKNGMTAAGSFSYQLIENTGISLNEAKTGFTVDSDALEGRKIRIRVRAEKENSDGRMEYAFGTVTVNVCNHNFVQKSLKAATCTEAGTKILECSKCHSVTKTETLPAAGHKPGGFTTVKAATCTEAGSQQQKCTACGKVMNTKDLPKTGHSFGDWKETAKPTALKQGTETRTCKTCNAAETRKTEKLKATIKLNVKKIPLQVKKSTAAVKVVSMTEGDG
ncbi:MAG: hypothetical protein HFH49_00005, partial [Lachnospiraceae bacterium]|nr:hypothetical protein [Lachnospiraceae bacterium]